MEAWGPSSWGASVEMLCNRSSKTLVFPRSMSLSGNTLFLNCLQVIQKRRSQRAKPRSRRSTRVSSLITDAELKVLLVTPAQSFTASSTINISLPQIHLSSSLTLSESYCLLYNKSSGISQPSQVSYKTRPNCTHTQSNSHA